ncbi:MAG: SPOR domain-containing protein [Acidobacteriia bacterium]|nr:SPOR domain-containing protein [Terriglobia bacterium]
MAANEEGEFELVLGNKQLLSVFFIVVVLLGVFFTMGYIVGRSTTPASMQAASSDPQPMVVDPPAASRRPSPVGEPPSAAPAAHPMETAPAKPESVKPEPPKPVAALAKPVGALPSGTYLQVAATKQAEAELLADVLRKQGFPAATEPVPESVLIRVIVGPLKDSAAITSTRTGLEGAGFKSIIKRK